ncbi:MAG: alpha/beta fold hydrolase, partial [Chloroflexi bacterium]|nr:alpha/beta fold hydrolase [Chloroflexota bacterium]
MTTNAEPRSGWLDTGDLRLHYAHWGGPEGAPPLLLLHGLSANARTWDEFATAASVRYRVVALDQRGHGDSGWSPSAAYGTFDHMSDLALLLDHLDWEQAAIVGSSMGGRNALALAAAM